MLAAQMAAVHIATMTAAFAKFETIDQQDSASSMFNKCAWTFAALIEALPLAATIASVQAKPMTEGIIDTEGCLQVWGGEPYARGIVRNVKKGSKLTIIENDTIGTRVARYWPPAQLRGDPRG
jgi:hypothetical protein